MKKKIIIIAACVVVAAVIAIGVFHIVKQNQKKNPDNYKEVISDTIKIPGYTEITMTKNVKNVSFTLENPEGNPCNFVYEIILTETEEVLFKSDSIAPGSSITEFNLTKALGAGTYPVKIKINTYSIEDGSPMNDASFDAVIVAQ